MPFLFVFPVVLIGSQLYVIYAGLDEPSVSQAKWVRTQRELKSSSVDGLFEFDVVNIDAFPEYIDTAVIPFVSAIAEIVATDPLRYTGETWTPPEGSSAQRTPP